MDDLLMFWGKTPKVGDPPEQFHLAIYHMLDVAFVAEALLRDGAPRLRRALCHAWVGCDPDALIAWLPFLIATHDLGKISAAFQGQTARESRRQRDRLLTLFPPIPLGDTSGKPAHSLISAHYLQQHLARHEPDVSRTLIKALRDAMSGHHGFFSSPTSVNITGYVANENSKWEAWREAAYVLLRAAILPEDAPPLSKVGATQRLSTATVALTGFIILCDWIGSNNGFFEAKPDPDLSGYLVHSRKQAALGVLKAGFTVRAADHIYPGFQVLFPQITLDRMRPLQQVVETLQPADLPWPALFILEAPTGEGKTEAALALARKLAVYGCSDEIYFGLPTMATGNQMFKRLDRFFDLIDKRLGEAGLGVKLIHGYAALLESDLRVEALANDVDSAQRQAALEWFASSKKNALLAPRGVGTVDQVELAGLNVRHYMLRLMALAGKVVIIDEVHAYDEYMSTILEHTLRWLAELNTSVILLSATLPMARHRALARSFLAGLPHAPALPANSEKLNYPILATYAGDRMRQPLEPPSFRPDQILTIRFVHHTTPLEQARHLLELVAGGGAVARICNLVDDAQKIYQALLELAPDDCLVLLHSRFPLHQRKGIEKEVERRLGKPGDDPRPRREIVVGTQVLEQSLDYDVDVMVSDLAPIDLLLQRAGRLHRHEQERNAHRPARHRKPVLYIQHHKRHDTVLPLLKPWDLIYDDYVQLRSWAALRARADTNNEVRITLPEDYRVLIEQVYHQGEPELPDGSIGDELRELWLELDEKRKAMANEAQQRLTPPPHPSNSIVANRTLLSLDDQDGALEGWQYAKTRQGERVTVVPLYRHDDRLWLDEWHTDQLNGDITPRELRRQHEIIEYSLPISSSRLMHYFLDQQPTWPWGDTPSLLRYIYPLELDNEGKADLDGITVRLDRNLGLVIARKEQG